MTVQTSDLQSRLRTALAFPSGDTTSLSAADALTMVNLAMRDVQTEIDLFWCEASTTYALASGAGATTFGNVPADYNRLVVVWILDDSLNTSKALGRIERLDFATKYPPLASEATGFPQVILRWAKALFVRPKTDKAYTLRMDYMAYLADLSAASDNNDITNNCSPMIVARAAELACTDLFGWQDEAVKHNATFGKELTKWHHHNVAEKMSGSRGFRVRAPHQRRRV